MTTITRANIRMSMIQWSSLPFRYYKHRNWGREIISAIMISHCYLCLDSSYKSLIDRNSNVFLYYLKIVTYPLKITRVILKGISTIFKRNDKYISDAKIEIRRIDKCQNTRGHWKGKEFLLIIGSNSTIYFFFITILI